MDRTNTRWTFGGRLWLVGSTTRLSTSKSITSLEGAGRQALNKVSLGSLTGSSPRSDHRIHCHSLAKKPRSLIGVSLLASSRHTAPWLVRIDQPKLQAWIVAGQIRDRHRHCLAFLAWLTPEDASLTGKTAQLTSWPENQLA